MGRTGTIIATLTTLLMTYGVAQSNPPAPIAVDLWHVAATSQRVAQDGSTPSWMFPVASLLVPGSGQLMKGQDRGVLYLAAEVFILLRYGSLRAEGHGQRKRFRTLAFEVARAAFRPARRDTVFEYFEVMQLYVESGPFSTSSGPELTPPSDESTYNGHIWRLARETFFPDPAAPPSVDSDEYQRAITFYRRRAIGPNFQWSWRNAGLEQDLFRQSIGRSDDALRAATQYLGLVLANHLLGAIDALVSQRLGSEASLSSAITVNAERDQGLTTSVMFEVTF